MKMITHHNILEMTSTENLIEDFLTYCPELLLNTRILNMYAGSRVEGEQDIFKTLMTYGLQQKFKSVQSEWIRDYQNLSELHAEWMTEFYTRMSSAETSEQKNLAYLALGKALNVKFDLQECAKRYALWSEFHEVSR